MEKRTEVSMKTPDSIRIRVEKVLVILINEEVLIDFKNFAAKRTKLARRNMLAAKANVVSAENMVELNESLFDGWKIDFKELKFERDVTVKDAGVKALQMAEWIYRRVLAEGEGLRIRRLEK